MLIFDSNKKDKIFYNRSTNRMTYCAISECFKTLFPITIKGRDFSQLWNPYTPLVKKKKFKKSVTLSLLRFFLLWYSIILIKYKKNISYNKDFIPGPSWLIWYRQPNLFSKVKNSDVNFNLKK